MKISGVGLELIKRFEGCRLKAYLDPVGIPTIGYGHTKGVKIGQKIDMLQAEQFLREDLEKAERLVMKYDPQYHWNQNQFDALVSFCYNIGSISQLVSNGERTINEISAAIPRYNKAGGRILSGLTKRRNEERALFDKPVGSGEHEEKVLVIWDSKAVRSLQEAINADGIKDINGNVLKVDGIKGAMTTSAVEKILLKSGDFDANNGRYGVGTRGQIVKWLQMRLNTVFGQELLETMGAPLTVDGLFGTNVRSAVGLFQCARGLKQDYLVGAKTITELLK